MEEAASYRVRGNSEDATDESSQPVVVDYEGEWAAPGRVYLRTEQADSGGVMVTEVLSAGEMNLHRDSFSQDDEWAEFPQGAAVTALWVPRELAAEPRLEGVEVIEGQPVYHVVIATEDADTSGLGPGEHAWAETQHLYVSTETYRFARTVSERVTYFVEPVASADTEPEWFTA